MLKAQDIRVVTFDKGMRGYNTVDVDAFLVQLADQMEIMEAQKAEIEKKDANLVGQMVSRKETEEYGKQLSNKGIVITATSKSAQNEMIDNLEHYGIDDYCVFMREAR